MAFRPWTCFILLSLLGLVGCGGGGSSGSSGADGGAGGESGASGVPTLSIGDARVTEGDIGSTDVTFRVTLSDPSSEVVKVAYRTEDGTAQADGAPTQGGADYVDASATLRFDPGETTQTFTVTVNGDHVSEPDEVFNVVLAEPLGATIAHGMAVCTIANDDAEPPVVSIGKAKIDEGNAGAHDATLTVSLSAPSTLPVNVDYKSKAGTATDGDDYVGVAGTLVFAPGTTTRQVSVPINGDTVQEPDETLVVSLSNAKNATLGTADGTLTIVNDDAAASSPRLSIDDAVISEGNAGTKLLAFAVSLSASSTDTVTVDYATIDDTATAGGLAARGSLDYVSTSGTLTFAPGETSKQVDVMVNGDTLNEANESFNLELFNGVNAIVVDPLGVGTIDNDDALPSVAVSDVSVVEGAAGTRTASFVVSLANSSGQNVSIGFATADGTALAGQDYVAKSGTLLFNPGETSNLVSVTVNGDLLNEGDETFFVDLVSAVNGAIDDSEGLGTISNDDPLPQLSIDDVALSEGDAGSKNAVFTVSLSSQSGQTVSVDWTSSDDTATAGQDYVAGNGSLSFAPGIISRTISVAINGDALDELSETFDVDLSNAVHGGISDGHGVGTIIADDSSLPGLNIDDVSVAESDSGTTTLTMTVTLDNASAQQIKVNYATAGDTATSVIDFQAASGTLTFDPGQTFKTIDILVNGDTLYEPDETLLVTLSGAINAFVADGQGVGTIANDDTAPSLSIGDVIVAEGNAGTKLATFTIALSAASSFQTSVAYATSNGTAVQGGSASAGQDDYQASSSLLVLAPGQTSATISVPINGDLVAESNETFFVQLSAAQNASIADGQGQGTITNDDALPILSIDNVSAPEGNAGTKVFTFTVTLSAPSASDVSVDFATADGSALSGSDYDAANGTLSISAGQTTGTIAVTVIGDQAVEGKKNETFSLKLTAPVNATISASAGTGLGTILNDD